MSFSPSDKYQRSIVVMLRDPKAWAKKRVRPLWNTVLQRAAVILLVASISLGSLMAISPRVRAAVIQWVTEWYEESVIYRYFGDIQDVAMPRYEIAGLPEGYVERQRLETPTSVFIEYENDADASAGWICLSYTYMQEGAANGFETVGATVIPVTIHGMSGQIYLADDPAQSDNTVTWIDKEKNIQFDISGYKTNCVDEKTHSRNAARKCGISAFSQSNLPSISKGCVVLLWAIISGILIPAV